MDADKVMGILRMVLVFAGGIVTQMGWMGGTEWDTIAGALISLVGVAWSLWVKSGTTRVPTPTLTPSQKVEVKNTPVVAK